MKRWGGGTGETSDAGLPLLYVDIVTISSHKSKP